MHTDFDMVEIKYIGGDKERKIVRATKGSAGIDLHANNSISITSGSRALMPTGVAVHIGYNCFCGIVCMRSGIAHKRGLRLSNGVGIIDSDYQGEIKLSLHNTSLRTIVINIGERIAQLLFVPIAVPELIEVREFTEVTDRGEGGFGSTTVARRPPGKFEIEIPADYVVYEFGGREIRDKKISEEDITRMLPCDYIQKVGHPPVVGDVLSVVCDDGTYRSTWIWDGNVWRLGTREDNY